MSSNHLEGSNQKYSLKILKRQKSTFKCTAFLDVRSGKLSQPLQESIGLGGSRKQLLLRLKIRRMHAPSAPSQPNRMLQVQHLVIDDVFQHERRNGGMIENPADDDCVVCRIVMAKNPPGPGLAPAHAWASHQSMKEMRI